ncbi:MAG: sugar phosphate isomerase/epimerase family protein [Romboutsia sp.]
MKDIKLVKIVSDIYNMNINEIKESNIGVEIQSFPQDILDKDYSDILNECKNKLYSLNCTISLHGASFDLNPGSTDKKVLELTRFRYMQCIEIAKNIGANYVIFHSQLNPLISVPRIRKLKLDNQINFWKNLLEEINDLNITILLENEYDDSYEELLYILKEVNSNKLKMCLDIGHVLAYSNRKLEEWVEKLKDYIKYIHLHFNDGSFDSHTEPNEEELMLFKDILKKNNIKPIVSLEYTTCNIKSEVKRIRVALKN